MLPSEAVVEVGDDISFHCIFPEDFSASVTWQGPYLKKQGPVLYLENVNISSTGKYTCSVVNNEGMMTNASTHLTVQSKLFNNYFSVMQIVQNICLAMKHKH